MSPYSKCLRVGSKDDWFMCLWWWGPPKQGTWLCGEEGALLCGFGGGTALHRTTPHHATPRHTTPHHAMSTPQHYPRAGCRVRSPPRQGPGTAYLRCTNSVGCTRALAQSTTPREQAPPSTDLQGPGTGQRSRRHSLPFSSPSHSHVARGAPTRHPPPATPPSLALPPLHAPCPGLSPVRGCKGRGDPLPSFA